MFTKRNPVDIKKSTAKLQDPKKDVPTRIKHLKLILENVDTAEAKGVFEANFSHIYILLYESFVQTVSNLKQRELSFHLVPKTHKEELECTLWILEQVLCLLPELIHRRWQIHSIGRIISHLLHPGNSVKLRKQGIRFFLMWYQALHENSTEQVDNMFASIVPGFGKQTIPTNSDASESVFHVSDQHFPVSAPGITPIFPRSSGEKAPEHASRFYLEMLLENMVQTVVKLEWHDKSSYHHRSFNFLLEKFKVHYLPKICPNFCSEMSLYRPNLDLPLTRKTEPESEYVSCRVSLIMWITNYVNPSKRVSESLSTPHSSLHTNKEEEEGGGNDDDSHDSAHPSLDSTISVHSNKTKSDDKLAAQIVWDVLYSTQENINFVHELYRQAFLLNFTHVIAVRKIIGIYKDLIQGNITELPPYALEPPDEINSSQSGVGRNLKLRNDSYLGAIHKENVLVRAGLQNVYQLFITHAANVFLLEVNPTAPRVLEEQTDACKRVLNIYRYMVMNSRMDTTTWEQLLLVLLQITLLVLGDGPPKRKSLSLGGKLAPAIFQTLIVTWIKANLNVPVSRELWDRFLDILMSLTNWEELIKEWAKTMETLTRVLARHVYNLDLNDLPLDRLNDQKSKKNKRFFPSRPEYRPSKSIPNAGPVKQGAALPEGGHAVVKRRQSSLSRSYSEANLSNIKSRPVRKEYHRKHRRSKSLELIPPPDTESIDRSRSPSPAPSSGLESNSMKDSPIQLDLVSSENHNLALSDEHRGIICNGTVRGWLPDVAVILWKRMLGALGDVNQISDPKLHSQVFEYLNKLTSTLIKIKQNQGILLDSASSPPSPELIPPITLIVPWCFGALSLPDEFQTGKEVALRVLITVMLNCDEKHRTSLPQFYCSIHSALTGSSKSLKHTAVKYLGPRFLSFQLPGASILLLDLVLACNDILNSSENLDATPRSEAVSILTNLLSLPDDLSSMYLLQPDSDFAVIENCSDIKIKEHVVDILLRAGRREPTSKARCLALSGLAIFVYKELSNQTFHPKITDAVNVLLSALKINNKTIARIAGDHLFLLCDHAVLLHQKYPHIVRSLIHDLSFALMSHAPLGSTATENDKALVTALLLCLGEWCMRLGPKCLLEVHENKSGKSSCLLLQVFTVLHKIITGNTLVDGTAGLNHPSTGVELDPHNIFSDHSGKVGSVVPTDNNKCQRAISTCAESVLAHIIGHLGHFPMAVGATRLSSLVTEYDDVPNSLEQNLNYNMFLAPNIQLLILTKGIIASLIELPTLDLPGGGVTAGLVTAEKQVRVLLRDLVGKSSWDASILYKVPESIESCDRDSHIEVSFQLGDFIGGVNFESFMGTTVIPQNLPQRAMRRRPPDVLPEVSNSALDLDQLDDLLQYLGHTSPECLESQDRKLNTPANSPLSIDIEQEAIAQVIQQRNLEMEETRLTQHMPSMLGQPVTRCSSYSKALEAHDRVSSISNTEEESSLGPTQPNNAFHQCRLLFSQLNLAGWERRKQLHLLSKTERLLRELRNLDNQTCRETHKFAVVYVAPGQEDKATILSNQSGSVAYEQFVAALAWEIELEFHTGFLGGLQRQGATGMTAPYVATSFIEAVFHVSTRMPGDTPEAVLLKTKHLGNDEVHIVWSEHNRDYRRDIIPTEFCDVLITIYPLGNNLNRVTVDCKDDVPQFGILFNEAVVESNILAALVRATAICASRAKRSTYQFYQQFYEERCSSLDTVISKHKHSTTYEEFLSKMYNPGISMSPFCSTESLSLLSQDSASGNSSMLTAALLDSHGFSYRSGQRADHRFRVSDSAKMVWINTSENQSIDTNLSPRPLKKLSENLKNSRKSLKQESSMEYQSPPQSPLPASKRK